MTTGRFNIIGFGSEDIIEYKQCPLDPGIRLEKIKGELRCPKCGYTYRKEEAVNEESVKVKHLQTKPAIITAKKKKKYYDKSGNEIKDPDLFGKNVISYHEDIPKR